MSEDHPTAPAPSGKPAKPSKPSPDFPLTAHPAGVWCKKIRGKIHYFGPWDDPGGALKKYLEQKGLARPPFGDRVSLPEVGRAGPLLGRRHHFFFATSWSVLLSSSSSATSSLRRATSD